MSQDNYKGKGSSGFYAGADYGFDAKYGQEFSLSLGNNYTPKTSQIGVSIDLSVNNQILAVSKAINTGAKTIEASAVNITGGPPGSNIDKMPIQQWKEINRLKKLTNVDLTFHGPLVEPTGITRGAWDSSMRVEAEKQMWSSVERAQQLDDKGNLIIVFHSSNGLPEPETKIKLENGKEVVTSISVINKETGQFGQLNKSPKDYFDGKKEYSPYDELKRYNEQDWTNSLSNINIGLNRSREVIENIESYKEAMESKNKELGNFNFDELYKMKLDNKEEFDSFYNNLDPSAQKVTKKIIDSIDYVDVFIKDSYRLFKDTYNKAYGTIETNGNQKDREKLDLLAKNMAPIVKEYKENPSKVIELAEAVSEGLKIMKDIEPPQIHVELKKFAVDQASTTFSNVAFNSYNRFKEHSPIIAIENPPVGMGLSRAEDLKSLIEASREKLAEKLMEKNNFSERKAKQEAEKLIGATWDVGHINMVRKHGYSEDDVVAETKIIAPFVKHVHLSDNFGMEHTELPMGMGNVPTKPMLEAISKYNAQAKKIIEAGDWISRGGLSLPTPLKETFRALGSPIYSMQIPGGPNWGGGNTNASGGYYSGMGRAFPDRYFNTYGSGFSNLPQELGGQVGGRSRVSGAPMD